MQWAAVKQNHRCVQWSITLFVAAMGKPTAMPVQQPVAVFLFVIMVNAGAAEGEEGGKKREKLREWT